MKKLRANQLGFGAAGVIGIIIVLVIIGAAGVLVYLNHQKKSSDNANTSINTSKTPATKKTITPVKVSTNIYAGWKTYCDTTYNYCFKYPSGWTIKPASQSGTPTETTIIDPANSVVVTYTNPFVHDGGLITFTPTYISSLNSANEAISVVGGIAPGGGVVGKYVPEYFDTNSSELSKYPLTIGVASQFVNNPMFSDNNDTNGDIGSFIAQPYETTINTTNDAQIWLNSASAKEAIDILASLSYQKS